MADKEKIKLDTEMEFTANVKKSLTNIEKLTQSLNKLAKAYDEASVSAGKLTQADKDAAKPGRNFVRVNKDGGTTFSYAANSAAGSRKANDLLKEYNALLKQRLEYEKQIKKETTAARLSNATTRAQEQKTRAEKLAFSKEKFYHPERGAFSQRPRYIIGRGISSFGTSLKNSSGLAGRLLGDMSEVVGRFVINPIGGAVTAMTSLGKAVIDVSKAAVEASAQIEVLKTNLAVVYGSQTQSDSAFREISQYAVKSPFGIEQTTEMAILLKQSGVYASDLMSTLKMIGDTAGGNAEKMKRIANNYAQIVSIGKASMLDMRQFAYAGIPIFEAVSKELNVSQAQLRKLISDGKVTSDIIEKVFKDLTGINGLFENATEKGAKTVKARLQNLKDAQQLALASVGDYILNLGASGNKDSFAKTGISILEGFYQRLENWTTIKNIEKNVQVIADKKYDADFVKELAEQYEKNGKIGLQNLFQEYLKSEKLSIDEERKLKALQYQTNVKGIENLKSPFDLRKEKEEILREIQELESKGMLETQSVTSGFVNGLKEYNLKVSILKDRIAEIDKDLGIYETSLKVTTEQLIAYNEVLLENHQQTASDFISKNTSKPGSIFSTISEIKEAISQTDKAKLNAEREKRKRWDEALKLLREVSSHTDNSGKFSTAGMSFEKIYEYLSSGAFSDKRDLKLINTDTGEASLEDIALARNNYLNTRQALLEKLEQYGAGKTSDEFANLRKALSEQVLDGPRFAQQLTAIQGYVDKFTKKIGGNAAEEFKSVFGSILLELKVDKKSLEYDLEDVFDKASIALWRRIEGEAFGINPALFSSSDKALEMLKENRNRNIVGGVLGAQLKSGDIGIEDISNFYANHIAKDSNGNLVRGKLSNGDVIYQTDWNKASKDISSQAGSLFSRREVFDTYLRSLEDSRDKLIKLFGTGLTTMENQDVSGFRNVSFADAKNILDMSGDSAVNAFGASLVDKNGKEIIGAHYNDIGQLIDSLGNELNELDVFLGDEIFGRGRDEFEALNEEIRKLSQTNIFKTLGEQLADIGKQAAEKSFLAPFETIGKSLVTGADAAKDLHSRMTAITAGMLQQIGPAMAEAGFSLISAGAKEVAAKNYGKGWGMISLGMGLAATGGFASGLGAGMQEQQNSDSAKDDVRMQKAEALKDQLAELLAQARSDALYYEKNLRHKTALGINNQFSHTSVNDAIISPSGDVITTHPDDFLIATKTPQKLLGGGSVPKIIFKVVNNAGPGITVRQEERRNDDGTIEAIANIEQIVGSYIASSRSDDAFQSRQAREVGVRSIM